MSSDTGNTREELQSRPPLEIRPEVSTRMRQLLGQVASEVVPPPEDAEDDQYLLNSITSVKPITAEEHADILAAQKIWQNPQNVMHDDELHQTAQSPEPPPDGSDPAA